MRKKCFIIVTIIVVIVTSLLISIGFQKRTDVVLFDYSVSEDGTANNLGVQVFTIENLISLCDEGSEALKMP